MNGVAYGDEEAISGRSFHLANRIKTFTEEHEDGAMLNAIRARVESTETVVFLGFGYYKQNLELIAPDGATKIKKILGTGFGLSDDARTYVIGRLTPWHKGSSPFIEVTRMKCAELLDHYRMGLSA